MEIIMLTMFLLLPLLLTLHPVSTSVAGRGQSYYGCQQDITIEWKWVTALGTLCLPFLIHTTVFPSLVHMWVKPHGERGEWMVSWRERRALIFDAQNGESSFWVFLKEARIRNINQHLQKSGRVKVGRLWILLTAVNVSPTWLGSPFLRPLLRCSQFGAASVTTDVLVTRPPHHPKCQLSVSDRAQWGLEGMTQSSQVKGPLSF